MAIEQELSVWQKLGGFQRRDPALRRARWAGVWLDVRGQATLHFV